MDTISADPSLALSPFDFSRRLGRPHAPLVLDVRRTPRFLESPWLLPTAQYCAPEDLTAFAARHPPQEVLVYCVHGHEVSQTAAALLRTAGWNAHYLQGGIEGSAPTITKRPDLGMDGTAPSRWITRERPKIDRIACPWLVQRFIDARAVFLYAPAADVLAQASHLKAVAYDTPGAPISHDGPLCSFDTLLHAFELRLPALDLLATVVRGADTDRLDLAAQSAGLLAVSLGMSRLYTHDDHAMLAAMLPVYDALYAWCGDRVAATDERHTWKA